MKLLALVYSVTLASLSIGTHAYDHHDNSAHLRGTIEAIKFLTEDECIPEGGRCRGCEFPCCEGLVCSKDVRGDTVVKGIGKPKSYL